MNFFAFDDTKNIVNESFINSKNETENKNDENENKSFEKNEKNINDFDEIFDDVDKNDEKSYLSNL